LVISGRVYEALEQLYIIWSYQIRYFPKASTAGQKILDLIRSIPGRTYRDSAEVAMALRELKSRKEKVRNAREVEVTEKPSIRGGRAATASSSISAATIAKVLSGIDFPKSKNDLKEYARDHISKAQVGDTEAVFSLLDELPPREYSNMADVEREIGRIK
jgi:hypothetical protein